MHRIAFVLLASLVLAGCATSSAQKEPPQLPEWDRVPRMVLDEFCSEAQAEGLAHGTTLHVVAVTQPILNAAAFRALGERSMVGVHGGTGVIQQLNARLATIPIDVPQDRCPFRAVPSLDRTRDADMMVVQMTSPMRNPFTPRETGMLLRMSLGGETAQWFWLPLGRRGDQWMLGRLEPLAIQE